MTGITICGLTAAAVSMFTAAAALPLQPVRHHVEGARA